MRLIMFGDSITQGWNGSTNVEHPLDYWISKKLNITVDNHGHNAGRIFGNRDNDLMPNISAADLGKYDAVSIAYGINDFDDTNVSLDMITEQLINCLGAIRKQNKNITIYGILPLPTWLHQPNQNTAKNAGFTENELIDALIDVYLQHDCFVLDWRLDPIVTKDNYQTMYADGVLHPSQSTYELLGNRIADYIDHPQTPLQIWQSAKYHMASMKARPAWWGEWGAKLRFLVSNDGDTWHQLPANMNIGGRDPSICQIDDTYYIIFTIGLVRTTDFIHFEDMNWLWGYRHHHVCWAPEFFKTADGNIKVIFAGSPAGVNDQWSMNLYTADFDPKIGPVESTEQQVTGDMANLSTIDPNMTYFDGQYHLFYDDNVTGSTSSLHYATATNYSGPFTTHDTNINADKGNLDYEGPELITIEGERRLYLDAFRDNSIPQTEWQMDGRVGEAYKVIQNSDLTSYSNFKVISSVDETPFQIRHIGFMIEANPQTTFTFMRLTNGWALASVTNSVFGTINHALLEINNTLTDNYGDQQLTLQDIPLITSNMLGRVLRLDMLAGFDLAVEQLNMISDYFSAHNLTNDGKPLPWISVNVPRSLLLDSGWVAQYNQALTIIEERINLLIQIMIDTGLL